MPHKGFAQKIDEWRFLIDQSRPLLTEAPHLAADHAAFEALVKEAEDLRARGTMAQTARVEATKQRKEAERRGMDMRDRFAGALVYQFGARSEKLRDFGVTPKPTTRRKAKEPEPAPGPGDPASPNRPATAEPPVRRE